MYTVYCHTFPHGKVYVGLTKLTTDKRFKNGGGYKSCPLMERAIQKWGWENIDHDVIAEVETLNEAERLERYIISFLRSNNPNFGYNVLSGGDVSQCSKTEELRYKLGRSWRGKKHTEEQRRKISLAMKGKLSGEKHPLWGTHASDETREKQSKAQLQSWKSTARKAECSERLLRLWTDEAYREKQSISRQKCVQQYDKSGNLIAEYPSVKQAAEATGAPPSGISACCTGRKKSAGGFIWRHPE